MIGIGVDVGSVSVKVVALKDNVLKFAVAKTGVGVEDKVREMIDEHLRTMKNDEVTIVSTGQGRHSVGFANRAVTEISAGAMGARWFSPSTRTAIDIGGQGIRVVSLNEEGEIVDFLISDRCSSGTGCFLELMVGALGTSVEKISGMELSVKPMCPNATCTVFAETEAVSLVARGVERERIIEGLYFMVANKTAQMVRQIGLKNDVMLYGGVAKMAGVKDALAKLLGVNLFVPDNSQIVVGAGAALMALKSTGRNKI